MISHKAIVAVVAVVAVMLPATGPAAAAVFIDFSQFPDGTPSTHLDPISDSYAGWGVWFQSFMAPNMPVFAYDMYHSDGMFAWTSNCEYPPGFNIVATFSPGLTSVSADVMAAQGTTVTMLVKDSQGAVLDSVTSPPAPATFSAGNLSLTSAVPIESVEWWPSVDISMVGIDNLSFVPVPEPATLALLAVGGLLLLRRRRRDLRPESPC